MLLIIITLYYYISCIPDYYLFSVQKYDVAISVKDGREKLREIFTKNKQVTDVRAIDLLAIKVAFSFWSDDGLVVHASEFVPLGMGLHFKSLLEPIMQKILLNSCYCLCLHCALIQTVPQRANSIAIKVLSLPNSPPNSFEFLCLTVLTTDVVH